MDKVESINNFEIEKKLEELSPNLHNRFRQSISTLNVTLNNFNKVFPTYTDHSMFHSLDVLELCNALVGDNISKLNADECYVLCMSAYMHDIGMGINKKDFVEFTDLLGLNDNLDSNHDIDSDMLRKYHNEYSGCFINKYAEIYEIPTEEHKFAIIQVSRGHRKTDLFDYEEYPDLKLNNGNIIHLKYLSAIIRLADELDVTVDRNPSLEYDLVYTYENFPKESVIEFSKHEAIRSMSILSDQIVLNVKNDEYLIGLVKELASKVNETLSYCRKAANEDSDFEITQKSIDIRVIGD